ncbi:MAG TPA: hypothetical protein VK002_02495, partial [Rubricoccaceae bacterium]|nr:hypothetical protein [Rubricoccaceae bacterium]
PTPDTTAPWRYYPLHVGDAWEYYVYFTGDVLRREVTRDTTFNGHRYFILERYRAEAGGELEPDWLPFARVRFDTTSAFVVEPYTDGSGTEVVFFLAPCPFNADFNSTVYCPPGAWKDVPVTGGYEGVLVFGDPFPGTGEDTVHTAWKEYDVPFNIRRYAAGFGEVYYGGEAEEYGLYYARIDGVEYGVPRYPTASEPGLEPQALALAVWPNPARGRARVALTPEAGGLSRLAVHDLRGRRVLTREVAALPGVRAEVALDLAGLAPGVYAVRLAGAGGAVLLTVLP